LWGWQVIRFSMVVFAFRVPFDHDLRRGARIDVEMRHDWGEMQPKQDERAKIATRDTAEILLPAIPSWTNMAQRSDVLTQCGPNDR
jgi:hypothetical protein